MQKDYCLGPDRSSIVADGIVADGSAGGELFGIATLRASSNFARSQASRRRIVAEYSPRIMSPGMIKTHPGMIGMISPTIPIRINPTPAPIRKTFFNHLPPFAAFSRFEKKYLLVFATHTHLVDARRALGDSTMEIEMSTAQQNEKIYRVWSAQLEDQIAIRVQFSVEDAGPTRLFVLGAREEWV
jgi:hypothetical protein